MFTHMYTHTKLVPLPPPVRAPCALHCMSGWTGSCTSSQWKEERGNACEASPRKPAPSEQRAGTVSVAHWEYSTQNQQNTFWVFRVFLNRVTSVLKSERRILG